MGFSFRFGNEIKYENTDGEYLMEMEKETFDVCDPELTVYPRDSVRLISYAWADFVEENLPTAYSILNRMKIERNVESIIPVLSIIDEINAMGSKKPECEHTPGLYEDRVQWFQYWANKCSRLYGDEAKFSVS